MKRQHSVFGGSKKGFRLINLIQAKELVPSIGGVYLIGG